MIGVGITTRNRPELLKCALEHWAANSKGASLKLVVVDDASEQPLRLAENYGWSSIHLPKQRGIAGAKSVCLSALQDCDYVFLCDDDMFPCRPGWEWPYILAHLTTGIHHFSYLEPIGKATPTKSKRIGMATIETYDASSGVLLFLTKTAIQRVGAFYPNYKPYGFEHSGYSKRINRAGLQPSFSAFIDIYGSKGFWWSVDWRGVPPGYDFTFSPSLPPEQAKAYAEENSYIYVHELNSANLHYPLPPLP